MLRHMWLSSEVILRNNHNPVKSHRSNFYHLTMFISVITLVITLVITPNFAL